MSKPWGGGGIGAWAAEAEREEEEELAAAKAAESQSFPSLKEAVSAKPKKKKMTLSLNEFNKGGYSAPNAAGSTRLTTDEMLRLPTGPKERSAEEMISGRFGGGGFNSYGRSSGPNQGRGAGREDSDGSWGGGGRRSYGGFDDERRGPPSRVSDFDQPSRADEVDNWASAKKTLPAYDSGRGNRYGGGGGGAGAPVGGAMGGGFSRADEVDNWAMGKRAVQPAPPVRSSSTFGSGFRDSGPEPDRWARGVAVGSGGGGGVERERPRLVLDPRKENVGLNEEVQVVKTNKPNPFGAARPREEILAEKGLDWKKLDSEIEAKKANSRPSSAHSSRPSSVHSSRSESVVENVVRPRPKVNPFGDAKPREVLLEEQGKDWRKIDQQFEHLSVDRPETEEEKKLKEEINQLHKELESTNNGNSETVLESGGDRPSLQDIVLQKERDLELLIRDLDDKVRFGQKAIDRPGSAAGRAGSFIERTPSHSGSFDDSRNMDFVDRPRSHGKGDGWPRDDRRGYQGGRERGFQGVREGGYQGVREGGYQGVREGGYQGGREGGYQGGREGGYQGVREGGYHSGREGGYHSGRDGGYQGGRDGGYQGGRDGGYQGGRDGGYQGGRDGGFHGGRERGFQGGREGGFLGNRDFNRSSSRERW